MQQEVPAKNPKVAYALDVVGLSKSFRRQTIRSGYTTIKSSLVNFFFRRGAASVEQVCTRAIKDLTLRIPRGASVGIIGRNGSGKSTFLKLLTGIYKPDCGTVSVNGRIAALIELGAGFHPDFTGRENLFLGGIMHGLTRAEVQERFDDIVRFAELEQVIDDPVRTYSSGMYMRLGFSLAIHTDPDILLVDEVLAVGDAAFVAKCKERIAELRRKGKTLLLVTHDLEAVERWCDEALWLDRGEVKDRGDPRRVIDHYRQWVETGKELQLEEENREIAAEEASVAPGDSPPEEGQPSRWGSREIEITSVELFSQSGERHFVFHPDDACTLAIAYRCNEPVESIVFGIGISRGDGVLVHGSNTDIEKITLPPLGNSGTVYYRISRLGLLDGEYSLDVAAHRDDGYPFDYHKGVLKFGVRSPLRQIGVYVPAHEWHFEPAGQAAEKAVPGKSEVRRAQ